MKPPKHIFWDWNGTLQDDVQAAVNGINLLLRQRQMPEVTVERHRELFDLPVRGYYEALGFRLESENWDEMANTFINAFANDPSAHLFPETKPTLALLAKSGIDMFVVTSGEQDRVNALLHTRGIRSFFQEVRGLDNPGAGSKIAVAQALIQTRKLNPADGCMIGDTLHDKEVADAIGCPCLLLASGYQSRARLENSGCTVLDSIADIPAFWNLSAE